MSELMVGSGVAPMSAYQHSSPTAADGELSLPFGLDLFGRMETKAMSTFICCLLSRDCVLTLQDLEHPDDSIPMRSLPKETPSAKAAPRCGAYLPHDLLNVAAALRAQAAANVMAAACCTGRRPR